MNKLIIIDGNSLINRAYFALPNLKNKEGVSTGGVHGLINMIFQLLEEFNPSHMCVAFDVKGPTIRHHQYKEYKGTRKGMDDDLAIQMPIAKEILDALAIPRIEFSGYEADDLIGTLAKNGLELGWDVHIITGDKDALQLVDLGAVVHITKKGISNMKAYGETEVVEELGVASSRVIDYKGLCGDKSDNIPGIPGIGPKTAVSLLKTFDTVEETVASYDQIPRERISKLVEEYSEQALLSKKLATIITNVPIEYDEKDLLMGEPDVDQVVDIFQKYELRSLNQRFRTRIGTEKQPGQQMQISEKVRVADKAPLSNLRSRANQVKEMTVYAAIDDIQSITYFTQMAVLIENQVFMISSVDDFISFKDLWEDPAILKSGFDLRLLYLFSMQKTVDIQGVVFDGKIASYLLDPARRTFDPAALIFEQLKQEVFSEEELLGKGKKKRLFSECLMDQAALDRHMLEMVQGIEALNRMSTRSLKDQGLFDLFCTVELPLLKVLCDMEFVGFALDVLELQRIDQELIHKIKHLEEEIYEIAGEVFNINSPKQLGVILFEKMGLKGSKKTKTGYSTSHDVLEKLAKKTEIAQKIIDYRTYAKLKSTYVDGLQSVVAKDGRVHTSLTQTIAVTGRLSSKEPNLQNIPIRLAEGREIRKAFIASAGHRLIDADYSQIELRVLAHLSKDLRLVEAFQTGLDIHAITASQVFGVPEAQVTSLQRSRAKEVNFGIVYGMGDFGLSESLKIGVLEAREYIKGYFATYPGVQDYMEEIITKCESQGYVVTLLGRKRYIRDIHSKNYNVRTAAQRVARNTPIQGSAADIIKLAMIEVYEQLKKRGLQSRMILQVHDELIIDTVDSEVEVVKKLLMDAMEHAYELLVPLKVDMNEGESWFDAK